MNILTRRGTFLAALATIAALWLPVRAQAQQEINFGIISTESTAGLKSAWQPLIDDMEKATGLAVKPFFAPDYAGVIEGMRFNKVQMGWFGNKSGMEAVDRANGEVFAKVVNKDGTQGYYSLLIVPKDSPLKSLDDVIKHHAELTLGFGDPNSTSGTVVPGYFAFGVNHIDPLKDFKRTVRANHESNLLATVNKQVDVATNNTEDFARFEVIHPEQIKQVREIWRSPQIPSDPIVWRKDLDPAVKAKVRDFLLGYGNSEHGKAVLARLGFSGFRASSDAQLVMVRKVELAKQRVQVEQDTTLSAADKAAKLKAIDERLAALGSQVASAQ
jgi:phosphonate transport system substrate-binding protein